MVYNNSSTCLLIFTIALTKMLPPQQALILFHGKSSGRTDYRTLLITLVTFHHKPMVSDGGWLIVFTPLFSLVFFSNIVSMCAYITIGCRVVFFPPFEFHSRLSFRGITGKISSCAPHIFICWSNAACSRNLILGLPSDTVKHRLRKIICSVCVVFS